AAGETSYYARLFVERGLDAARLGHDDLARLPLTPKAALRDDPDAFVRRTARPVLRAMTTGTTGRPTQVAFSARELAVLGGLSALGFLQSGLIAEDDVVHLATGARGIGNWTCARSCARIGAL